eukprot:7733873-Pyramimonas_sp.AAC.2
MAIARASGGGQRRRVLQETQRRCPIDSPRGPLESQDPQAFSRIPEYSFEAPWNSRIPGSRGASEIVSFQLLSTPTIPDPRNSRIQELQLPGPMNLSEPQMQELPEYQDPRRP